MTRTHEETSGWLAVLLQGLEDGIVLLDRRGAVIEFNRAAAAMLGASDADELQQALAGLELPPGDGQTSFRWRRGDTSPLLNVVRASGPAGGSLLRLRDQKRLDDAELDLQLASRMRSLESVYRSMAHEIKAPLNAAVLNLDLLREALESSDLEPQARNKQLERLDIVGTELSRLHRLVQTLLSHAGSSTATVRRVDLRRVQREIVELLRPQAVHQGIELRSKMPREPVAVQGNRDRLKQALLNLTVNGMEATEKRGSVELELRSENGSALLEIRDEGAGIPAHLAQRVYEPHFTTKSGGSGIGLGVANSVLRGHGGRLELLPRRPRGTVARISLPLDTKRKVRHGPRADP